MQAYSDPTRENDPHAMPDVEVFYVEADDPQWCGVDGDSTETLPKGWYYWFCFPGCLPDSSPQGPFTTEAEALADAQSESEGQS